MVLSSQNCEGWDAIYSVYHHCQAWWIMVLTPGSYVPGSQPTQSFGVRNPYKEEQDVIRVLSRIYWRQPWAYPLSKVVWSQEKERPACKTLKFQGYLKSGQTDGLLAGPAPLMSGPLMEPCHTLSKDHTGLKVSKSKIKVKRKHGFLFIQCWNMLSSACVCPSKHRCPGVQKHCAHVALK